MERIKALLRKNRLLMNIWVFIHSFKAPLPIIIRNHVRLKKLKNRYSGERCFIIGNGPSLNAEDLEKIRNEYSFASNSICKIFAATSWRPTFYCVQDEKVLANLGDELFEGTKYAKNTFIRMNSYRNIQPFIHQLKNLFLIPIVEFKIKNEGVKFSRRIEWYAGDGWTVTYMAMQIAVYMGFNKIYLLGVDHSFPFERKKDGSVIVRDISQAAHFYETAADNVKGESPRKRANFNERVTNGYIAAEEYSRICERFRIYNATRGGKLEVFERVDFDNIVNLG